MSSQTNVPINVFWFEVLLYVSLILDSISVAFQDRTPLDGQDYSVVMTFAALDAGLILLQLYFVWLSAHKQKNWPRWVLIGALVLAGLSLPQVIAANGLQVDTAIEIVSCALTAVAIFLSFTGDAQGWFKE